ncbi:MAG TPA: sugar nucleotide-binding protein, partial [Saprospiraceae bacterium]|nr:sugar nucleotide-binding protein [Saprospiraceae bacterium]
MMNVIVFGANGQLGRTFQYLENDYRDEFQFHFYSSNVADISNVERLKQLKSDIVPDVVINCAA